MSEQKTALVTGASRGIGAAIAAKLIADGFFRGGNRNIRCWGRIHCPALGDQGAGLRLDISNADSVADVMSRVGDIASAPVVLVNNAGITKDNLLMRMSEAEWSDVIDTNLSGAFRVTKPVLRGMLKARWGRIVNVGSVVGRLRVTRARATTSPVRLALRVLRVPSPWKSPPEV